VTITDVSSIESGPDLSFTTGLKRARVRVPTVLQMEATECGAASLGMVLAHYGRWVTLEELRAECGVSRDGMNAKSVVRAARSYGLEAQGVSIDLNRIPAQQFPCIAYWNFAHFLVIEGADRNGVYVNDPARGRDLVSWEEADRSFTGLILRMSPGPDFQKAGKAPSVLASIRWRLTGMRSGLLYLLLAGLALAVPVLLSPLALQAFVQQYLVGGIAEWALISIVTMLIAFVLSIWIGAWQGGVARRVTQAMSARESLTLMRHVLRLPVSFFAQRYPGEIAARLHLADAIARVVTQSLLPAVLGLITSLVVAVALLAFAWPLAVIAFISAAAVLLTLRAVQSSRTDQAGILGQDQASMSAAVSYSLRSIETIKATGGEDATTRLILGHVAKVNAAQTTLQRSSAMVGVLPAVVTGIGSALIVGLGGVFVALGTISVGAYIAVMALVPVFLRPVSAWSGAVDTLQQARTWLARLDDLLEQPVEQQGSGQPSPGCDLELRSVSFRYAPGAPDAVSDLSLRVAPGRRVALVGASGSGKSTAARIAVGLLPASEGEVMLGDVDVTQCAPAARSRVLGYVEQEVVLFAGSIRDNITLFDDDVDMELVRAAARAAAIDHEIEIRPGGYDAMVADGGRNLSGGQRQRLELARVMLRAPGIVVLDEATSALDPLVEAQVMESRLAAGAGLLIIAHRLSTVRDCDEIVVMARGQVVERGTHDELMVRDGEYARLVASS